MFTMQYMVLVIATSKLLMWCLVSAAGTESQVEETPTEVVSGLE